MEGKDLKWWPVGRNGDVSKRRWETWDGSDQTVVFQVDVSFL